jgi:hypothetical protein
MERAVFLLEKDNTRIPSLLNPESVTMQRTAGVRLRSSSSGPMVTGGTAYDPLLYTDGGRTELTLDLLFDVSLVPETAPGATPDTVQTSVPEDVRDLTRPLMVLAEGPVGDSEQTVPYVRFIWGKAWNLRGVVVAAAERLEYFTEAGVPQRSWLRMRFVVVPEPDTEGSPDESTDAQPPISLDPEQDIDADDLETHEAISDGEDGEGASSSERLDEISTRYYGTPSLWRLIAEFNNIDDPTEDLSGRTLQVPPKSASTSAETV